MHFLCSLEHNKQVRKRGGGVCCRLCLKSSAFHPRSDRRLDRRRRLQDQSDSGRVRGRLRRPVAEGRCADGGGSESGRNNDGKWLSLSFFTLIFDTVSKIYTSCFEKLFEINFENSSDAEKMPRTLFHNLYSRDDKSAHIVKMLSVQDSVSQILLVGGATRIPKVQDMLLKVSGKWVSQVKDIVSCWLQCALKTTASERHFISVKITGHCCKDRIKHTFLYGNRNHCASKDQLC